MSSETLANDDMHHGVVELPLYVEIKEGEEVCVVPGGGYVPMEVTRGKSFC